MGFVRHRQSQRAWDDVAPEAYADPSLEGVERHDLIGSLDEVPNYHVRYFHVEPGKQTRREQHPHDHGVVIQNGRARVTLGDEVHEVGPGDVVYVSGDELHCFEAIGDEPLGFICVIPPLKP
ncbi:MAG TPA: cupin domain-containing protein [Solirubrobacteraceae bacterium]|jgi:S-methyl-1-thioxylulose 5-phosphate methylthiotransferase